MGTRIFARIVPKLFLPEKESAKDRFFSSFHRIAGLNLTDIRMLKVPLEDTFVDVLVKAQNGLRLSESALSQASGISLEDLRKLKSGEPHEANLRQLARTLQLGPESLVAMARKAWSPERREVPGLAVFNTTYSDMTVNAYLAWDRASKEAVAFDTGANAYGMLATVRKENLKLRFLLLTHTHGDHVADVDRIVSETRCELACSAKEPFAKAKSFDPGQRFQVGALEIETRATFGHSPGGTTFVIHGLGELVAVVGDAIFASSMGGGKVSYADALATNRSQILSLPDSCILCPGHGPLTTVGEEKRHNPFFPEFQNR